MAAEAEEAGEMEPAVGSPEKRRKWTEQGACWSLPAVKSGNRLNLLLRSSSRRKTTSVAPASAVSSHCSSMQPLLLRERRE